MKQPSATQELENSIQLMEMKFELSGHELKKELVEVYEKLKPSSLITSSLNEISSSPILLNNVLRAGIGLAGGYFTKKIVSGSSDNKFRQLLGSVLEFGVRSVISQQPGFMINIGKELIQSFFTQKKETQTDDKEQSSDRI